MQEYLHIFGSDTDLLYLTQLLTRDDPHFISNTHDSKLRTGNIFPN